MFMLYVPETDTLEIVYRDDLGPVAETLDGPKEWVTMDVDGDDRLVSMTIEHATIHAPPHVQIDDARRLIEETEASLGVVYLDAEGHINLTATYEAAETPTRTG
jgi:hypothetical protein